MSGRELATRAARSHGTICACVQVCSRNLVTLPTEDLRSRSVLFSVSRGFLCPSCKSFTRYYGASACWLGARQTWRARSGIGGSRIATNMGPCAIDMVSPSSEGWRLPHSEVITKGLGPRQSPAYEAHNGALDFVGQEFFVFLALVAQANGTQGTDRLGFAFLLHRSRTLSGQWRWLQRPSVTRELMGFPPLFQPPRWAFYPPDDAPCTGCHTWVARPLPESHPIWATRMLPRDPILCTMLFLPRNVPLTFALRQAGTWCKPPGR